MTIFSLCGGNPQYPRTVHIGWTATDSLQEMRTHIQEKKLPFSNSNCSEASNRLYVKIYYENIRDLKEQYNFNSILKKSKICDNAHTYLKILQILLILIMLLILCCF